MPGATDTAIITNAGVTVTLDISPTVGGIILGINGAGTVTLSLAGQTLTLDGPLTVNPSGSFTVNSGTLAGNPNAVLSGAIGWTAGLLAGTLTLAPGGTLNITTGNNHNLPGCTFTNNGTVVWASGTIQGGNGTTIYNYGLWDAQSDQQFLNSGGSGTFINSGTFRKSVGVNTDETIIGTTVAFNQAGGVLDVQQGVLALRGGGNFTGGYATTNSTGTTILNGGSFTINGTVTSSNVWQAEGNLVGVNVIKGGLVWVEGVWSGATVTIATNALVTFLGAGGTLADGAPVMIPGGGINDLPNCNLTNYGTVAWSSGHIEVGGVNGTVINNQGLWDCQGDFVLDNSAFGGSGTFINSGTFRKSVTSGGSSKIAAPISFANTGTIDDRSGIISVSGSFTNPVGTLAVSNGATIQIAQAVVLPGGLVTGSGTVQAPSITSSAVVSPGATNAVLNLAGNYTQLPGGSIQFDIGGTSPGVNQSQVNVTGSASLSGLIALRFSPGYVPAVNSSNLVLTAASRSGQFPFQDHFYLLGQNKRIIPVYSSTNVVLATISADDPTNFSLSTVVEGQTFALGWPSEFGRSYFIATKTNLDDPAWTFFGFTNFYLESPMTSPHKFFRLFLGL